MRRFVERSKQPFDNVMNCCEETETKAVWPRLNVFWPRGYKTFSCSIQLSMKFFLLINVKMPTIVGILTFMSRTNSILDLSEPEKF